MSEEKDVTYSKTTMVTKCSQGCYSPFQDITYKGLRLHNATGSPSISGWRCTVCGNTIIRQGK